MPDWIAIISPNERVEVRIGLDTDGRQQNALKWHLLKDGRDVIAPSRLGLHPEGLPPWGTNLRRLSAEDSRGVEAWDPVHGEQAHVEMSYAEAEVIFVEDVPPGRTIRIRARVFDNGVAIRYERPDDERGAWGVAAEDTAFRFPEGSVGYRQAWPEDRYHPTDVAELPSPTMCPLLVDVSGGGYAIVHEAANRDAGRMVLAADGRSKILKAEPQGVTVLRPGDTTPWRVVLLADSLDELIGVGSDVASLCPSSAIGDTSWIVPGKCIREVTLSTEGGHACIDFAKAHGMRHILYDAGWYGHEYDDHSDPRTVDPDPDRTDKIPGWPGLDLQNVIDYGKSQGIGVFLYVNRRHLERYLDDLLPLFQKWGVAGIKFGFVNVGPAGWTSWLYDAIERCAEHQLMVDVHDNFRPSGLSRTYPNLLTQEGVRGNEHFPEPSHNCLLPYARFVAGAADYTVCYKQSRLQTTSAHQLAIAAAFYSPLQLIYWYSRPSEFDPKVLPEMSWFDRVPTVWDESVGLGGELGQWSAVARRAGDVWYVGVLNNEEAKSVVLPLERLGGTSWNIERFEDDGSGGVLGSNGAIGGEIQLDLQSGGGSALVLEA